MKYNIVEYVKDFFLKNQSYKKVFTESDIQQDAASVQNLIEKIREIKASNGKVYVYCFSMSKDNLLKAQEIFKKHGLSMQCHLSKCGYSREYVLRAPVNEFKKNLFALRILNLMSEKGFFRSYAEQNIVRQK